MLQRVQGKASYFRFLFKFTLAVTVSQIFYFSKGDLYMAWHGYSSGEIAIVFMNNIGRENTQNLNIY
jgi:hypothetical protein